MNEILRFADVNQWYWVPGSKMPCDIGTRKTATLNDVSDGSIWKLGFIGCEEFQRTFP